MSSLDLEAWLRGMPGASHTFETAPERLYSPADLYRGFDPDRPETLRDCFDAGVVRWLTGLALSPRRLSTGETIAARLHDTAIDRLTAAMVLKHRPSVAMMGSHAISRAHPAFLQFALIARALRRQGYLVISGGGPGLMEAANFGAFLAPCPDDVLPEALRILRAAPSYRDAGAWAASAAEARAFALRRMAGGSPDALWTSAAPEAAYSLGLPTWYYSTEAPNLFATHLGKYFFNSLREDGLVSVATAGIVFGMGEAGTIQEIFQNASLNYYRAPGRAPTPMVFVGREYWSPSARAAPVGGTVDQMRKPVMPLIQAMAVQAGAPFDRVVSACDTVEEVVAAIMNPGPTAEGSGCIAEARLAAAER
ncbi:MAG TPA: hypothetical protein VIJ94_11085 [Caulobacteraceae bacterium]